MEMDQVNKNSPQATGVENVHHKSETKRYSDIFREFDNLEICLVSPSGDDLLADTDKLSITDSVSTESKEEDDECCEEIFMQMKVSEANEVEGNLSAQEADLALCRSEDGVERALLYAKMWCRYAKDILSWMEKRISLEQEFAKNVMKAAEGGKANLAQQEKMALQYIYTMALDQDIKNSVTSRKTAEILHKRCYQALAAKKNEIDKWRREFKEQWAREHRRMNESVAALKKAHHQYFQRCDELEKVKAISAKAVDDTAGFKTLDKRRKSKDEAQNKVVEAELHYRQCLGDARAQQDELVKVKERIVSHMRKLIRQGDTVLKEATVNMFYFQRQQSETVPICYHNLEMSCRSLEPGEPYLLYIFSKPRIEQQLKVFTFQEYVPHTKGSKRKISSGLLQDSPITDDKKTGYSDNDSFGGSLESLSSPVRANRRLPKSTSTLAMPLEDPDDREIALESDCIESHSVKVRAISQAALTHRLKKLKSKMIKCRQCDTYIVVSGVECEKCGMALHRKCMEVCQLECEHKKGTVFGVHLSQFPRERPDDIPFVVLRCTSVIESRALSVQGVYRMSGSKPRIQKLCQAFETQKELVDLSEHSPHDITSILKHFFKELPEPLLTFDLYSCFITVGKTIHLHSEQEHKTDTNEIMDIIHNLQELLQKLPQYCYNTLQHLICHLQRVSQNDENKMSPSNLGIVFGPTLLRPLVSMDMSMTAVLETSYQALLVEFLIKHHDMVFGIQQSSSTPTPPAPTAPLPDIPLRAPCPLDGEVNAGNETSSRERPLSDESQKIQRESSEGYISDKSSSNEAVDQLSSEANERAVLAMKGASNNPQEEILEDPSPNLDLKAEPHYRFTRQPVKYYRHQSPATRLSNLGHVDTHAAAPARDSPGSADSSRSSSPEPSTQRLSQNIGAQCVKTQPDAEASENKADTSPSPREVVQYMLGLDMSVTSAAAETSGNITQESPREMATRGQADGNMNRLRAGLSRVPCQLPKTLPFEHNPNSPARILSGLKLRRSHSGKDEQLFV